MNIPSFDAYWDSYQVRHDPQWRDEEEREDEEAYYNYVDSKIDERLLERD